MKPLNVKRARDVKRKSPPGPNMLMSDEDTSGPTTAPKLKDSAKSELADITSRA